MTKSYQHFVPPGHNAAFSNVFTKTYRSVEFFKTELQGFILKIFVLGQWAFSNISTKGWISQLTKWQRFFPVTFSGFQR